MKRLFFASALLGLVFFGCAETPQQRARRLEPMHSAARFHMLEADTPQRQQELTSHTPLKVGTTSAMGSRITGLPIYMSAIVFTSATRLRSTNISSSGWSSSQFSARRRRLN
jgi:hypothetical protein